MFCTKCGKQLEDNWTSCPYCGESIEKNSEAAQSVPVNTDETKGRRKKGKKKGGILKKLLLALGIVIILVIGIEMLGGSDDEAKKEVETTDVVKTLEEVGGFAQWKKDGFPGKVRTDIIVDLPVTVKDINNYAVRVGALGNDIIIIMNKDETATSEWEWLVNAAPYLEDENKAYFKATLKYLGQKEGDEYPVFLYEDIEPYEESAIDEKSQNVKNEYIFPDSDKKYLSEDAVNRENSSGGIDTSLIQEYCNEVGYYGEISNAYLYFGSINGDQIEITLADELGILDWYTGTIIDKNTVEFTSGDCLQTIHFNGNYSFTITGNPGIIDLSGDYFINAG